MISILMPVKNAGRWLKNCLASIRDQSFKDWELLAVDDHSDDSSFSILQESSRIDDRVTAIRNKGHGIVDALKTSFDHSSGDYIHRMDADDAMPAGKLEALHRTLVQNPRSVVTGKVKYFSEETISPGYRKYENWLNARVEQNDHWDQIYRECVIASPNWLIARESFEESKSLDNLTYPEDYHMVFKWYEAGLEVIGIDQVTHLWREHSERTSRNSSNYAQRAFFELKIARFVNIDRNNTCSLLVIGAGRKARLTSQVLNNLRQKHYRVVKTSDEATQSDLFITREEIAKYLPAQILCAVAPGTSGGRVIENFLNDLKLTRGKDYWFL